MLSVLQLFVRMKLPDDLISFIEVQSQLDCLLLDLISNYTLLIVLVLTVDRSIAA